MAAIKRNSELLSHIIDDILGISKMEVNKIKLKMEEIDLLKIVSDASHFLQQKFFGKGLKGYVSVEQPLPRFIKTDICL